MDNKITTPSENIQDSKSKTEKPKVDFKALMGEPCDYGVWLYSDCKSFGMNFFMFILLTVIFAFLIFCAYCCLCSLYSVLTNL